MKTFKCGRCPALLRASMLYVQRNWPVRCNNCGAVHHPSGEVISPPMLPAEGSTKYSPWQQRSARPITRGVYHCKFRDVDVEFIALYWNGCYFQPSVEDTRPVQMETLLSWRGVWP